MITAHDSPIWWPSLFPNFLHLVHHPSSSARQRAFHHWISGSLGGGRTRRMSRYGSHHRRERKCFPRWWQLKYFLFSSRSLEKSSNLTSRFFKWVETTNWFPRPLKKVRAGRTLRKEIFVVSFFALFVMITSPFTSRWT